MRAGRSGGVVQEATRKHHATMPEPDGRHLWIVAGVWKVSNPARERHELDLENLLTLEGPGCFWCETQWRPDIGAKCPGDASEDTAP